MLRPKKLALFPEIDRVKTFEETKEEKRIFPENGLKIEFARFPETIVFFFGPRVNFFVFIPKTVLYLLKLWTIFEVLIKDHVSKFSVKNHVSAFVMINIFYQDDYYFAFYKDKDKHHGCFSQETIVIVLYILNRAAIYNTIMTGC